MEAYPDIPNDINIWHSSHGLLDNTQAFSFSIFQVFNQNKILQ